MHYFLGFFFFPLCANIHTVVVVNTFQSAFLHFIFPSRSRACVDVRKRAPAVQSLPKMKTNKGEHSMGTGSSCSMC